MRDCAPAGARRGGWRIPGVSFFALSSVVFSVWLLVTLRKALGAILGVIFDQFSLLFLLKKVVDDGKRC